MTYIGNCVNWPSEDVNTDGGLCDMVDSGIEINRSTFCKKVSLQVRTLVEKDILGYPSGHLTIAKDSCVRYFKGLLHGKPVFWIEHSAIEYVFG